MRQALYDLYEIGGPAGFYVGQAKRLVRGGWTRRVERHRGGQRGSAPAAYRLLVAGAPAQCIGAVCAERAYINLLEARAWDRRVARGWLPVHIRPKEGPLWATAGGTFTAEHAAKISAALRGRKLSPEHRAACSAGHMGRAGYWRGKKRTPETKAKMAAAHRGVAKSAGMRAKMSALAKNRTSTHREKLAEAARRAMTGRRHSVETRQKMSAAQRVAWQHRRTCA